MLALAELHRSMGTRLFAEQQHMSGMMTEMYRFVMENHLCDLTILIKDEVFNIHKCIFAATCPLLRHLVEKASELSCRSDLILKLHGVDPVGFKSVLAFVYTGRFPAEDSPKKLMEEFSRACESLSIRYPIESDGLVTMKDPVHDVQVTLMPENGDGVIEVILRSDLTDGRDDFESGDVLESSTVQEQTSSDITNPIIDVVNEETVVETSVTTIETLHKPDCGIVSMIADHQYAHEMVDKSSAKTFLCSNCGSPLLEKQDDKLNKAGKFKYSCNRCNKTYITIKVQKPPKTGDGTFNPPIRIRKKMSQSRSSAGANSLEIRELEEVGPSAKKMSFYSADGIIRPFVCQLCGSCFTRNHSLKVHMETVCMSRAPVKCLGCNKVLASKQSFNGHVRKYHPDEKPGWASTEWNSLIRIPGQKKRKLEGRTYQCHNCAAVYMSHHHFLTHQKKCTEVTALKCPCCAQLFQIRKEWEKHVWQHQNENGRPEQDALTSSV